MIIRDIDPQDRSLYFQMAKDFYHSDATLFSMTSEKLEATFNQALSNSPFLRLVFMEKNKKIVGYSLLAFYWSNEAGGMVTQLEEFYILPNYRGNQFGHQFLTWLLNTYTPKTARFRLEVCKDNSSAQKLYKKYGFQKLEYIQMIKDVR